MNVRDIRAHLRPYSILQRRKTTVNHAFASALAPSDAYDEVRLARAMTVLGQADCDRLQCVYCSSAAETWDHLVGLVKDSELRGYGHQVGNLVPACRRCNSLKGSRDWREYVRAVAAPETDRLSIETRLGTYLGEFASRIDIDNCRKRMPKEWARYCEVKGQIFELMAEADRLAAQLRPHIVAASGGA